jgi:hypothetical protein
MGLGEASLSSKSSYMLKSGALCRHPLDQCPRLHQYSLTVAPIKSSEMSLLSHILLLRQPASGSLSNP